MYNKTSSTGNACQELDFLSSNNSTTNQARSKPKRQKASGVFVLVAVGIGLLLSNRSIGWLVFGAVTTGAYFEQKAHVDNRNHTSIAAATMLTGTSDPSLPIPNSIITQTTNAKTATFEQNPLLQPKTTSGIAPNIHDPTPPSIPSTTTSSSESTPNVELIHNQKYDPTSALLTPAQACRLEIEEWLNPLIDQQLAMRDAMPPLIDWAWDMGKYVLVNLKFHRVLTRNRNAFLNGTWRWQDQFGNDFPVVDILGKRQARDYASNFAVFAPSNKWTVTLARLQIPTLSTNSTTERSVPVSLSVTNVSLPKFKRYGKWVYDLRPFMKCDKIEKEMEKPSPGANKVGICVRFRGDHHMIAPFIAYHRLLGVDHFWFYSNEPFNITDLPILPYVTYVPYRFVYAEHANKTRVTNTDGKVTQWEIPFDGDNFWQQDVQQQCLYRSKRYGLDWLMTNDLDEYLWLNKLEKVESKAKTDQEQQNSMPKIKQFLQKYMRNTEIGALAVDGWAFGGVTKLNATLPFDYYQRTMKPGIGGRTKLIYRVPKATRIGIHWLLEGGKTLELPITDVRWNHYRSPTQGIFGRENEAVVYDLSLPNTYRKAVLESMASYNVAALPESGSGR